MQHDILQIKGCRSIAKYLCNSLDGITKHVYIYISLYIRIYLSTRTRCNIAYKVTSSICRIRQRQSCIQARQANGASMGGILFSLPFWVDTLQLWKGQNRFGWFNWWVGPNLLQIEAHMSANKKSWLWPINANWSHRHCCHTTDWWSSTLHGLGMRPSSGEVRLEVGPTHQPTKPLTISRWWFQTCCMFNFY